jgi:hypothetical protein
VVLYVYKLAWRRFSRLAIFCLAMTAAAGAKPAADELPADGSDGICSGAGIYIFVGGTGGFDALRDGDLFKGLLQTGHAGLYQHANAVSAAANSAGLLESIEEVFSGTGPGEAELGQVGWNYFTLPPSYGYYQEQYVEHGLSPSKANVNTPSDSAGPGQLKDNLRRWKEYVDAARSVGIRSVAPVVAPNAADEPKLGENVFATDPFYELERDEALYGRAIAFDVPPNFFLSGGSGPGYQKFIVQAIQWGNARGLRTTMLLSPYPWPGAGNTFSRDTRNFVRYLDKEKAVPSEWAVDNYEDTDPNDAPAMVPDTARNTTTGVGLWLARHAPVYVHDDAEGVICRARPPADDGDSD